MYESFFGLYQRPFLSAPRAEAYFPATSIETARQTLARLIERGEGPGIVIGPSGTGKSLLCHVLAAQFRGKFQVAHLASARLCTRRALLQAILYELRLPYRDREEGELRLALIDHLSTDAPTGSGVLLLVDEAHGMPFRLLEEIRMMTNLVRDGHPRMRLVLAGSPALEERFANPKLTSFQQRVAARCYLEPFTAHDTTEYVRAQLAACGGSAERIFTTAAIQAVHVASDGIPRLVNQICDHALVLACAGGVKLIEASGVEEAWADLQQLPLPWNQQATPRSAAAPTATVEFGSLDDETTPVDSPRAIKFPSRTSVPLVRVDDADAQFDRIEQQLGELEDDFEPAGTIGPEVELRFSDNFNPFAEPFEDEEVVLDRYASLDDEALRGRQRVSSRTRPVFGDLFGGPAGKIPRVAPVVNTSEAVAVATRPAAEHSTLTFPADDPVLPEPSDEYVGAQVVAAKQGALAGGVEQSPVDGEILIVEDEPAPVQRIRRQEYRQLFARLRQG